MFSDWMRIIWGTPNTQARAANESQIDSGNTWSIGLCMVVSLSLKCLTAYCVGLLCSVCVCVFVGAIENACVTLGNSLPNGATHAAFTSSAGKATQSKRERRPLTIYSVHNWSDVVRHPAHD